MESPRATKRLKAQVKAPTKAQRKTKSERTSLPPEVSQLADLAGEFMSYWGFRSIHGRIWGHLYTSSQPLSSQALLKRLKVSKGLLSIALRELHSHQVIEPVGTGTHGSVLYRANPDLNAIITRVLRSREANLMDRAGGLISRLHSLPSHELAAAELSTERLEDLQRLFLGARGLLGLFLSQCALFDEPALQSAIGPQTQPKRWT